MQVWKSTGRKPKELKDQPDFPDELRYVWEWYQQLGTSEPITFTEIKNWSELTHKTLLAWEVELIRTLDRVYWRLIRD